MHVYIVIFIETETINNSYTHVNAYLSMYLYNYSSFACVAIAKARDHHNMHNNT